MNKIIRLIFYIYIFLLFNGMQNNFAYINDDVESSFVPWYIDQATGNIDNFIKKRFQYDWPFVPNCVAHTIASYQYYGGNPYFHHGIDIMAPNGTSVVTPSGGRITNIEKYGSSDLYWEVAVTDNDGFIWQFHHIDKNSIPQNIHDAFQSGNTVPPGSKIGEIVYWPVVSFGERFNHIHLNIFGVGGRYVNGLLFLKPLDDTVAPVINEIGLLQNGNKVSSDIISGNYSLFLNVYDEILHNNWIVPTYDVVYSIDGGEDIRVYKFDELPGGGDDELYLHDYYVQSMTCGDYSCREFVVNLGFTGTGTQYFTNEPGPHIISVTATDVYGNNITSDYNWTVRGIKADYTYEANFLNVTFIDDSYSDTGIISWDWNFGDGNTSAVENPVHSYTNSGTYRVTLEVRDGTSRVNSIYKDIILNAGPTPTPVPVNLALQSANKTVSSELNYQSVIYGKANGTDGNDNTFWGSDQANDNPYYIIDLAGVNYTRLTKIVLKFYDPYFASEFRLGLSNNLVADFNQWLITKPIMCSGGTYQAFIENFNLSGYRYVLFYVKEKPKITVLLREFEVWGY